MSLAERSGSDVVVIAIEHPEVVLERETNINGVRTAARSGRRAPLQRRSCDLLTAEDLSRSQHP
jgi:hypothetical protein